MDINIKNLELLDEEVRQDFEQFLKSSLSEDAQDQELRSFLINFIDEGNTIDLNEIYELEQLKEWRFSSLKGENSFNLDDYTDISENASNINQTPMHDDLLSAFGMDGNDHNPISSHDVNLLSEFGYDINESASNTSENNSNNRFESIEIPAPDLKFTEFDDASFENENLLEIDDTKQPALENDETLIESSVPDTSGKDKDTQPLKNRIAEDHEIYHDGYNRVANGHSGGNEPSLGQAAKHLVSGALSLTGNVLNLSGKLVKGIDTVSTDSAKAIYNSHAAKRLGSGISTSISLLKSKKGLMTGKMRESLVGLPQSSNVIDIKTRMSNAIDKHDSTSVERDIKLISDKKLEGKRNALVSIMKGIEDGYPKGRLSLLEVAPGVNAGAAITSATSSNPTEKAMAVALLNSSNIIPDASNEMDFVANEYQRLNDTLESLTTMAQERGWDEKDIAKQFVEPVHEWMEKRSPEDELLKQLSDVQKDQNIPEVSQTEAEERKRKLDEMIEKLMKLVKKLFGQSATNEQGQDSTKSLSQSR
ncbi:hypothetical protein [Cellvibrio sp. QJXJ]|uniref:hypothetical protein n=1 Tax=Cellvibrio sp. QJXJ TaxID=2964606 RepID=UPI0021C2C22B|nr:hypothetical protein [Cellvibrio sp. QJXJ]UUA75125.1 hypothetical protein NNX04_21965 [Cellvibrio sp. QJXJ]